MNEQTIQEQYLHIIQLLEQQRLKEAQTQLEAYLYNCNDWTLRTRLEQTQASYQYMLQYMRQGVTDVERPQLYARLLRTTWEIADQTRLHLLDGASFRYYNSLHRNRQSLVTGDLPTWLKTLEAFPDDIAVCRLMPDNEAAAEAATRRREESHRNLFLSIWSSSEWSSGEFQEAREYLHSELLPSTDLCLMVSAVTLSLTECFDLHKVTWILDAFSHDELHVRQRALVGIALILHLHHKRLHLYPEVTTRLACLDEEGNFGLILNRVYIQLLRSQETEKIDKKMREEIIPGMMKNIDLIQGMKFGLDENGTEEEDCTADWEEVMEKSGLGDQLRTMTDLQMEGADVHMSSFSQLKKFPFFNNSCNWLFPFDRTHSDIIRLFGLNSKEPLLRLITTGGFFCESDKYSLCLVLNQVPREHRNSMMNQLTTPDGEELDEARMAELSEMASLSYVVSNHYIHDLYRFFKLSPKHNEMHDIFKDEFRLFDLPVLRDILYKPVHLKAVADFLFAKEHIGRALEIYRRLTELDGVNADIYQKIGYCLQREERYDEAIEAYRTADILKPDHLWTIRHLATCYRRKGDFRNALECYTKAQAMQPENRNVIFFVGSCLAELGRHDEALQQFFRLDLMEENNVKAWRAIAWCSFLCRKYEQAIRYYEKVLQQDPRPTDFLNAGHAYLVTGQTELCVEHYSKGCLRSGNRAEFIELFRKDEAILLQHGVTREDLPLIMDMTLM